MALSINITLFVQIFHFALAYWIISRIFLKPAYDSILIEQKKLSKLRALVVKEQDALALRQEQNRAEWQSCKDYFKLQKPSLHDQKVIILKEVPHIEPVTPLTQSEKEKLTKDIAGSLKSKVIHD